MTTHYVNVGFVTIGPDGAPITKQSPIAVICRSNTEQRVLPQADVPNSSNYPTIDQYLSAEAAAGYAVVQVGQTFIVTQHP
jgi:hypothetical protein